MPRRKGDTRCKSEEMWLLLGGHLVVVKRRVDSGSDPLCFRPCPPMMLIGTSPLESVISSLDSRSDSDCRARTRPSSVECVGYGISKHLEPTMRNPVNTTLTAHEASNLAPCPVPVLPLPLRYVPFANRGVHNSFPFLSNLFQTKNLRRKTLLLKIAKESKCLHH